MEIREEDWYRVKGLVEQLDRTINGNGKPGLWERIVAYINERDEHKATNAEQADMLLHHLLQQLTDKVDKSEKEQEARHLANIERFSSIDSKFAYAAGVTAVVVILIQHYWK